MEVHDVRNGGTRATVGLIVSLWQVLLDERLDAWKHHHKAEGQPGMEVGQPQGEDVPHGSELKEPWNLGS